MLDLYLEFKQIKSKEERCQLHNELVILHCEDCQETICSTCATPLGQHSIHNITNINDAFPKHKEEIMQYSRSLKEKIEMIHNKVFTLEDMQSSLITKGDECKDSIRSYTETMIRTLMETQQTLLDELDVVLARKNEYLARQKRTAAVLQMQMKRCNELVNESLEEWTKEKLLKEKSSIIEQMQKFPPISDIEVYEPVENADIYFQTRGTNCGKLRYSTLTDQSVVIQSALVMHKSFATLKLKSENEKPFVLPASLVRANVTSVRQNRSKNCDISLTNLGEFKLGYTLPTKDNYVLNITVGGVELSGSPFRLPLSYRHGSVTKNKDEITGLEGPRGIGVFDDNDIVIAENNQDRLTLFDGQGEHIKQLCVSGKSLSSPRGITISLDQHILITDNHRILKVSRDGVCVAVFGYQQEGRAFSHLDHPLGVAVSPVDGNIFVVDSNNNRIQSLRPNLTHPITFIDDPWKKHFDEPLDVAIDRQGCVYVADCKSHCVKKFSPTGVSLSRIGSKGRKPSHLMEPTSITINSEQLYVCERGNKRISIFQLNGKFLYSIETNSRQLDSIAISNHGYIYVSDYVNGKVLIY